MPPRRKPAKEKATMGTKPSLSPPISKPRSRRRKQIEDDEDDYVSHHLSSQLNSQSINQLSQNSQNSLLGRKNRLNDILAQPKPKRDRSSMFEEDDGFIYKRSQNDDKKKVSTPILQLNEELKQMSRDSDELQLMDIQPKYQHNFLDESSLQLSSPVRNNSDDYNYDQYVEQVSHHKITLNEKGRPGQQKRRSSYHNRGKRVLSIGNGFEGEPHHDVPVTDYYKLLDTSLPEPDRMRQLLVWCFKKKLDVDDTNKATSPEDQTVLNIAKVIKEEILRELMEKQISISWYSNNAVEAFPGKEITVPNPLNLANLDNIQRFSEKLKNIVREKDQWKRSYERSIEPIRHLQMHQLNDAVPDDELQPYLASRAETGYSDGVMHSVSALATECSQIATSIGKLEPSVDRLYQTAYQMDRAAAAVDTIRQTQFSLRMSTLLKEYMTRDKPRQKAKAQSKTKTGPLRCPTDTRNLLRSITRVEKAKRNY